MTQKFEMADRFNPSAVEQALYQHWEESGYFKPSENENAPSYCIAIPPPNVTGSLHMGHAFQQTLMDTLIRFNRMEGHNTLWQAGTDHAGIATQMVVERKIAAEEVQRCEALGVKVNEILKLEDLVRDDNLVFAATGITHGELLKGISRRGNLATTETLLIRGKSRTIRKIQSIHYLDRKDSEIYEILRN